MSTNRRRIIAAVLMLGLVAAVASIILVPSTDRVIEVPAGGRGRDFCLLDSAIWFNVKEPLDWSKLEGRPVLLEFWASWCAPCLKQIPRFNALQRRFADRGLVVIGVNQESAAMAHAYARQYNIEYAVCAQQRVSGVRVLPTTLLIDASGEVIYEAVGELQAVLLRAKLEKLPVMEVEDVLHAGVVHGFIDDRPAVARGRDVGAFSVELHDFLARLESGKVEDAADDVARLFRFYQDNMHTDTWHGDDACREKVADSILEIHYQLKRHSLQEGIARLHVELTTLLTIHDPYWLVRSALATAAGKILPRGEAAVRLLSGQLALEENPVVRLHLTRSLEWLDDRRTPQAPPASALDQAWNDYAGARQQWSSRVFGLPSDLEEYERYAEEMEVLPHSSAPGELITRWIGDYERYDGPGRRDVLLRSCMLDMAGALGTLAPIPREDQCRLENWLFAVFKRTEADELDWKLRRKAWFSLDQTGLHCLARADVLAALESRIQTERVREVRAYLELARLELLSSKP